MKSIGDLGFEVAGEAFELRLPTFVEVSSKKRMSCNMNQYRNLHHHQLNKQKINFKKAVEAQVKKLPFMDVIAIHYEIFAQRGGRMDTMNVGSVVDKYFSDAMVELRKLTDDDFDHIVFISFSFGGVCKNDAHAIATITPVRKKADMRILLEENEIVEALLAELTEDEMQVALGNYVRNNFGFEPKDIEISTEDGLSVEITAGPGTPPADAPAEKPKPKNKGGRPRGSRNKPKPAPKEEVTSDVDGSAETGGDDGGEGTGGGADTDTPNVTATPEDRQPSEEPETETKEESKPPAEGRQRKNLFEDEGSKSSSSTEEPAAKDNSAAAETQDADPEAEKPRVKKNSIFDT